MIEKVYLNGQLVTHRRAAISPFDHGFLYGYGLFEVVRVYHGIPFRLERHLARLRRSAEVLDFAASLSPLDLEAACMQTIQVNKVQQGMMRVTVSGGPGDLLTTSPARRQPTVLVTAQPYQPPSSSVYRRGYKAIISQFRRDSLSPLSQILTTSALPGYLAKQDAREEGADEALILNERSLLTGGSASGIFMVTGHMLLTPPLKNGVLPGVTREAILEIASASGIEAGEWAIKEKDIFQAQEAFLTSSLLEIMPLTQVSGQLIGTGKPGPVTRKLTAAYKKLVRKETSGE